MLSTTKGKRKAKRSNKNVFISILLNVSLVSSVRKPGYTTHLHSLYSSFLFSKLADRFQSGLSAICPCKRESGMKRKLDGSAEENVPTFVANCPSIMRLSPRLLLRPQEHLQAQKRARTFPNRAYTSSALTSG